MQETAVETAKPALVTGVAGFIGSHLAESLLRTGSPVRGVDCFNDNYGRPQKLGNLRHLADWDNFEFVPIDLSRGDLVDLVADRSVVYHLAAEPGVRSSWGKRYEQYVRNNVLATQLILEAIREQRDAPRLVYASSSSVYGDTQLRPTPEDAVLHPRSPYGQTKAAVELLCELYHDNFGVDAVGLRYFTVFGPRQRPDMAFNRLCLAGLTGQAFVVFGDGSQTRDFSYVGDIVDVSLAAGSADLKGRRIFNVGGGSPASLREVIDLVREFSGGKLEVRYEASEHGDVRDTAADTTLAREVLGFAPKVSLPIGLEREFQWLKDSLSR